MVWQADIVPRPGLPDRLASKIQGDLRDSSGEKILPMAGARGFLVQTNQPRAAVARAIEQLLVDPVVEQYCLFDAADLRIASERSELPTIVHVLLKPGVTDPEADSARDSLLDFGLPVDAVRTYRKYWLPAMPDSDLRRLAKKFLANDSIEQVVVGPLGLNNIDIGNDYEFQLITVPLRTADAAALRAINERGQLSLSEAELATIQAHFRELGRDPSDVELETIAQTWSEHCSHKTLAGAIDYQDERGSQSFENMF
jgi:phosphoribosylformylglycinamidine synthase